MIYLYAISEPGAEVPERLGLDDQPLVLVEAEELAGLSSQHERAAFDPEPEVLWRHDSVVEGAMAGGSVLPARFGTTFADAHALRAALDANQARLRRQLDAVRGCVELAVRVSLPLAPIPEPQNGRDYLNARLTRNQERRAAAERTLVPLEAHAVRSRSVSRPARDSELAASYLVRADAVDKFADQVKALALRHCELALSCTGPWPPYSFAEGAEA